MRTIEHRPEVCWGTIGDDLLLWSPEDRRLHVLNATAATVWHLADEPVDTTGLVATLCEMFGASPEHIRADIEVLIERLVSAGLCELSSAGNLRPPPIPSGVDGATGVDAANPAGEHLTSETIGPLRVLGVPMTVDTNDALLHNELSRVLDSLRDPKPDEADLSEVLPLRVISESGMWVIRCNGRLVLRASTRAQALRSVLSECNAAPLRVVDSSVVLHAAGANLGEGLVLFPGISNAGKSTLVAQLTERGHGYLTDEAVAVDVESLHAAPFHKALCLESASQDLLAHLAPPSATTGTWDVDPRTIGPGILAAGGLISALVFPTFDADTKTELRPLEPFDAMQLLLGNAFDFTRIGQPAFAALTRMANALPAYTLTHCGDEAHLDVLENLFGQAAAA